MNYRILLSALLAGAALSMHAAELPKKSVAWDGPQIETKQKAADKEKAVVNVGKRPFDSMNDPILKKLPQDLWKIIGQYVPYFYCSRELSIPHLKVQKLYTATRVQSGISTCFTDSNNQLVYMAEDKIPGRFRLYNHDGSERAYCISHKDELTKVFLVGEKKPYTFVTGSSDRSVRFWSEDGQEVGTLMVQDDVPGTSNGDGIIDFDINTHVFVRGKYRDLLAVTSYNIKAILLYDISALDNIRLLARLDVWGNRGPDHVKLISTDTGLKVVSTEFEVDLFQAENGISALCFYDAQTGRICCIKSPKPITQMDTLHFHSGEDSHAQVFIGDINGSIQGFKFDYKTNQVDPMFTTSLAAEKAILNLQTYADVDDEQAPHLIAQVEKDGVFDIRVDTQERDIIVPAPGKKESYFMGLGFDKHDRPCVLACYDKKMHVYEKDRDPFNYGCLLADQKPIKHIAAQATPPIIDDVPTACTCIIQ